MRYSEGLDTTGVPDLASAQGLQGNKDQSGLTYHLHYRETCAPASSEHAQTLTFGLLVAVQILRNSNPFVPVYI